MGGFQEGGRRVGTIGGDQAETGAFGGRQKSNHRRHEEAVGVEASRSWESNVGALILRARFAQPNPSGQGADIAK